jgi:hypothetical protein
MIEVEKEDDVPKVCYSTLKIIVKDDTIRSTTPPVPILSFDS